MHLRPIEHLENRNKKDSLHVFLHVFFCILQLIYKEKPNRRFFSKPNWNRTEPAVFLRTETELKKSIPHIFWSI